MGEKALKASSHFGGLLSMKVAGVFRASSILGMGDGDGHGESKGPEGDQLSGFNENLLFCFFYYSRKTPSVQGGV